MIQFTLLIFIGIFLSQNVICSPSIGGPAELNIKSVEQCPDPDQYKYFINVLRHKINRTHEAFDGNSNLGIPLDENTGIYINVAKKTNDVYKPNAYIFKETYACKFLEKWVGKGFHEILRKIGEPPSCPLRPGTYTLKNFIIDYREMPSTLPYGDFRADLYLMRDEEKVVCIQVFLSTKPKVSPF